ncbi:MAG: hypothetical protein P8R04_06810, partial [Gammaproteobacteria bacterium]|nr:hypothetical protein [Gammaproteobacteria bacterium]
MGSHLHSFQFLSCKSVTPFIANDMCRHIEKPVVFPYDDLWCHSKPMLELLNSECGSLPLNSLGGTYGWPVR